MTISFEATSKRNLKILDMMAPERYLPVRDMDDLVRTRWIPQYVASQESNLMPDILCVKGSNIDSSSSPEEEQDPAPVSLPTYSGLIGTILNAYNLHQNLVLRPDDIWTAILAQFSSYVNARAEELRSKFVHHSGKMELRVVAEQGSVCTLPYGDMTREFLNEIADNLVDPTLKE